MTLITQMTLLFICFPTFYIDLLFFLIFYCRCVTFKVPISTESSEIKFYYYSVFIIIISLQKRSLQLRLIMRSFYYPIKDNPKLFNNVINNNARLLYIHTRFSWSHRGCCWSKYRRYVHVIRMYVYIYFTLRVVYLYKFMEPFWSGTIWKLVI